jgi:hypothetical protein
LWCELAKCREEYGSGDEVREREVAVMLENEEVREEGRACSGVGGGTGQV